MPLQMLPVVSELSTCAVMSFGAGVGHYSMIGLCEALPDFRCSHANICSIQKYSGKDL